MDQSTTNSRHATSLREEISLTPVQQEVYRVVRQLLEENAATYPWGGAVASLVSLDMTELSSLRVEDEDDEMVVSIITPRKGHHELYRRLELLNNQEMISPQSNPILPALIYELTGHQSRNPQDIENIAKRIPRRVCQHQFRKNDIVWVCRTCQADETCVLCHACFSSSDHEGHDVAFYHAQAGGCCDCGDPDGTLLKRLLVCVAYTMVYLPAWDPAGFCPRHGPNAVNSQQDSIPKDLLERIKGIIPACIDWLVDIVARNAETAFERAITSSSRTFVFSPSAASQRISEQSQGFGTDPKDGLFIVLHADEVHSVHAVSEGLKEFFGTANYYADNLVTNTVRALRTHGQLVVYGTNELIVDCGLNIVQLWQGGDRTAETRVVSTLLRKVKLLQNHGLFASILTRKELFLEQRSTLMLEFVSLVAQSCDPLCVAIAESILPKRHLSPILIADFKMSAHVTKRWYSLLLTLLAVPTFKSHLAEAYCDSYTTVTAKYARGMGVLERSGYTLSVQFLNRVTYVLDLVAERNLLGILGQSLRETLSVACGQQERLDPNHFVLTFRRYSPCVSDLKCVLNVKGMPRVIAARDGTFLDDWLAALGMTQFMDAQVWRPVLQGHVEEESRGWVGAFNVSISVGSLYERLLGWEDSDQSPIMKGPLSQHLMPCGELTYEVLCRGVLPWQQNEQRKYTASHYVHESHSHAPQCLPMSTVAVAHGCRLAMKQMPVTQTSPFSFHLPLHRFAVSCLRELCLRERGVEELLMRLQSQMQDFEELMRGLVEFPALIITRAAQIRAGLWRRNGPGLNDQVLNYAEPPFCRNMRDADIMMLQFATLGRLVRANRQSDGMSWLVNLMIHRLGIFETCGLRDAPSNDTDRYMKEVKQGFYPAEKSSGSTSILPWFFSPAQDAATSMLLLEEFLHLMIVFISELPAIATVGKKEQTEQAKRHLYREVVHRLTSGPKTHSELSEVHHVLSHWDNMLLSEEGKEVNPDDATGAALGAILDQVAQRKISRNKMEPNKWELKAEIWDDYDPAFFHCSLRHHQTAAEAKPKPVEDRSAPFGWGSWKTKPTGWISKPYAPKCVASHPFFSRLRRDTSSDATLLAVAYRVLHMHCRKNLSKSTSGLIGGDLYESKAKSETALARTIHFLTLAAFSWEEASEFDSNWKASGGGSVGSLFHDWDSRQAPTAKSWIERFLIKPAEAVMNDQWYFGDESALELLRNLAVDGGYTGGFKAQDSSVRGGSAWLCEFALRHCPNTTSFIRPSVVTSEAASTSSRSENDFEMRKKKAKERALARMRAQAATFTQHIDPDSEAGSVHSSTHEASMPGTPVTPHRPTRKSSFGSGMSSASSHVMAEDSGSLPNFVSINDIGGEGNLPMRLLQNRPRCIICNDEDGLEARPFDTDDGESQRKRSKRRTENALGLVAFVQPSVVLKGGGGPPPHLRSPTSGDREFVGTHVALCGHAVHSECCEAYLASVSQREDRHVGKRDEFRCPMCQRLSNCLVPFIDVGVDWIERTSDTSDEPINTDSSMEVDCEPIKVVESLHCFLDRTNWWVSRQSSHQVWDGHCAFIDRQPPSNHSNSLSKPTRIRSLRKKDLYAAWNSMMRTPRLVRRRLRRLGSRTSSSEIDATPPRLMPLLEESVGETVVWRRLMDQIADISYRADSKRLGDDNLHDLFGEFRHYWPSCLFSQPLSEQKRQELSREKLLSKLLLSIQAFTYTSCCELYEFRRCYKKSSSLTPPGSSNRSATMAPLFSRFGVTDVVSGDLLIILSKPLPHEDGGIRAFDGRFGKLRYFALATMAAAGAISSDLVQIAMPFPLQDAESDSMDVDQPERSPIAFPVLLGHVLTHTTAAMFSVCGKVRAKSDSLDGMWPAHLSPKASCFPKDQSDNGKGGAMGDCMNFVKLGLLARLTQTLFGSLFRNQTVLENPSMVLTALTKTAGSSKTLPPHEGRWLQLCISILEISLKAVPCVRTSSDTSSLSLSDLNKYCQEGARCAITFLENAWTILQVLVPGATIEPKTSHEVMTDSFSETLELVLSGLGIEPIEEMLASSLVRTTLSNWAIAAFNHSRAASSNDDGTGSLRRDLFRTQGFRVNDWPSAGPLASDLRSLPPDSSIRDSAMKLLSTVAQGEPKHDESSPLHRPSLVTAAYSYPLALLTGNTRKSVPLLGGYDAHEPRVDATLRLPMIPTSYTDLYAELGTLLPDCEQTAVCLICGQVLNAGGRGECTRHTAKYGAGAGIFFLLQECSGLLLHKSKAAYRYIQSPR